MSGIKVQKISYGGWENSLHITNGIVDLIVTTDVGPRIIRYGFIDRENVMCDVESMLGLTGGDEWRIYGGHRLWHSPESKTRTYEPDNKSVAWEVIPEGIKTIQDVEVLSKMKKEMEISLEPGSSRVRIIHRITNKGVWPFELSVWSISAMAAGGKEVIPQSRQDTGLLPDRLISLWPYTSLSDSRVRWGDKYIILQQDPALKHPFKIGLSNKEGWAAYFNHNQLFIKRYKHEMHAPYPDFGVSYETYTNDFMLEMETLSPLTLLKPDDCIEHIEEWELFDNIPMPSDNEGEIEKAMADRVKTID
ncbi:MAG: hypothetical protein HZC48_08375 [Nitrospirae bacterium]|nr:hypothetical protein [Nitrospirota bacterium]